MNPDDIDNKTYYNRIHYCEIRNPDLEPCDDEFDEDDDEDDILISENF